MISPNLKLHLIDPDRNLVLSEVDSRLVLHLRYHEVLHVFPELSVGPVEQSGQVLINSVSALEVVVVPDSDLWSLDCRPIVIQSSSDRGFRLWLDQLLYLPNDVLLPVELSKEYGLEMEAKKLFEFGKGRRLVHRYGLVVSSKVLVIDEANH